MTALLELYKKKLENAFKEGYNAGFNDGGDSSDNCDTQEECAEWEWQHSVTKNNDNSRTTII